MSAVVCAAPLDGPAATSAAQTLDALHLPLWGSRLIEASAGTGKTWTIAALYLRLVLGHGGAQAFAQPLGPDQILVMTFTRAATRELSDRIRARLLEAARCFRGQASPASGDALLAGLLAAYPGDAARSHAGWRLATAAESMDDAAVHTIDAWCQRMLREHAFDSGCLFDEELNANERALQDDAARDYWRQQLYPLRGPAWDEALNVWPSVQALADDTRLLLAQTLASSAATAPPADDSLAALLDHLLRQRAEALRHLKHGWPQRAAQMQTWLDAQTAHKACPFNKAKLAQRRYTAWLAELADWATGPRTDRPDLKTGQHRLTPDGLQDALKAGARAAAWPDHFQAFADLMAALDTLPPLAPTLRLHAARHIGQRLATLKAQAGSFGFADMLSRLDLALDPATNGAAATRLRQRILAQYPVALIDEFQDTSPLQSRIFDRLYRIAENNPASALLLIGDPKQSIYGFRGADIHSYLAARQATAGRHYVLGTNHRSTAALVAAVNQLFEQAELRPGAGALLYRSAAAGAAPDNPLPFSPVAARGRPELLVCSAGTVPALSLVFDAQLHDGKTHQYQFAARCAEQIVALLGDAAAGFRQPDGTLQRLRPADIAVLVRTGREAAAVRLALQRRQVASVYLSDQESVFMSAEAADLLRWLTAIASPRDMRLARAALATRLVGLPLAELAHLATDDEAFDARSELLRQLHTIWQQQGVLTMLRQTLHRLGLPARWLAQPAPETVDDDGVISNRVPLGAQGQGGERRLTNVLHLAELLQAASAQQDGEQALIRWLASQIDGAAAATADEQIVRLESDADLVQVVTVHKSKGLEYPLVFLPFATGFRPVSPARTTLVAWTDGAGQRQLDLQPDAERIHAADAERLREDMRLLYVALTRARHALWVGLAALKVGSSDACQWHRSAIGCLLGGPAPQAQAALPDVLVAAAQGCSAIALQRATPADQIGHSVLAPQMAAPVLRNLQPYAGQFDRRWAIGSFSLLVRALPAAGQGAASVAAVRDDEGGVVGDLVADVLDDMAADKPADCAAASVPDASPATAAVAPRQAPLARADTSDPSSATASATATSTASSARSASSASSANSAVSAVSAPHSVANSDDWHHFPRGALPGNFLHAQLQWLADEGFALHNSPALQQALLRRCQRAGWASERAPQVLAWLQQVLSTALPPVGASLATVAQAGRLLPEMEFWLPSHSGQAAALDRLCRSHLLPGAARPALPQRTLHGMLMGFADLVFEHAGRFWVLDYKSNHLGDHDASYSHDVLQAAVCAHRYDVQAAIYLLALHRLLRTRLGTAYQPAQHMGGAIVYFLRGLQGPASGCCVLAAAPALLDGLDTLLTGTSGSAALA